MDPSIIRLQRVSGWQFMPPTQRLVRPQTFGLLNEDPLISLHSLIEYLHRKRKSQPRFLIGLCSQIEVLGFLVSMANPMMDSEKSKGIDGSESGAIGYGQFPMAQSQGVEAPIGVYGNASGTAARGKRRVVGELLDKATQQKQKRMIKNRESAATSRKRKHAYTMELEAQVKQLEEENEKLLEEVKQRKKERLKQVGGFCIFQNVAMDGRIEEESGQCKCDFNLHFSLNCLMVH